jgi:5-methylcytosine-specific restriction protein A
MAKHPRLRTLGTKLQINKTSQQRMSNGLARVKGSSWIAIKKSFELHNPRLCAECDREGLVGNGDELDHIMPLWAGGTNDPSNLQWLCKEHHKAKTNKEAEVRLNAVMRLS